MVVFYAITKNHIFEYVVKGDEVRTIINKFDKDPNLSLTTDDIKNITSIIEHAKTSLNNGLWLKVSCIAVQKMIREDQLPELPIDLPDNLLYYEWDPASLDLKRFSPWERYVLWSIWVDEESVRAIATRSGLSKSEVHITNKRALKVLKEIYEL